MSNKVFEILCVDSDSNSVITSSVNLLYRLVGDGKLWRNADIVQSQIVDNVLGLKLTAKKLDNIQDSQKKSFIIKVEGDQNLESFRRLILNHLKDEKFDYIYILTDEVSKAIAERLYPNLYVLENLLRVCWGIEKC